MNKKAVNMNNTEFSGNIVQGNVGGNVSNTNATGGSAMSDSNNPDITAGNQSFINTGQVSQSSVNLGQIQGSVTNAVNELPANPNSSEPGVKELLEQLKVAIETEKALSDEDKAEALEQVRTLAEVGKQPEDGALKKTGKRAVTFLRGIVAGIPAAAKLAEVCQKHLPTLAKLLGLAA